MDRTERGVKNRVIPFVLVIIAAIIIYTIVHFVFVVGKVDDNVTEEVPPEHLNERE